MNNSSLDYSCAVIHTELHKLKFYFRSPEKDVPGQQRELGVLITSLYALVMSVGGVGNMLTFVAVLRNPAMRTNRNFFIVNLALSDLLLCAVTAPFTLYTVIFTFWPLGEIVCKVVGSMQGFNIFVSTMSIAAIAMDRYLVVVFPTRLQRQRNAMICCFVLVWGVSLGLAVPYFMATGTTLVYEHRECHVRLEVCQEQSATWNRLPLSKESYSIACLVFQYLLPLTALVFVYSRIAWRMRLRLIGRGVGSMSIDRRRSVADRQRRMNILLVSIVVVFAVSWLPLNIFNLLYTLNVITSFQVAIFAFCHIAGMTSACANPVLYGVLNENFRVEFLAILEQLRLLRCLRCVARLLPSCPRPRRKRAAATSTPAGDADDEHESFIELPAVTVGRGANGNSASAQRNGYCATTTTTERAPTVTVSALRKADAPTRSTQLVVFVNTI